MVLNTLLSSLFCQLKGVTMNAIDDFLLLSTESPWLVILSPKISWWICDSFGLRNSISSVAGSGTWLAQCNDTMQQDSEWLGLPVTSPGQRRQKWLIDAAWLDRVRKEQAFLRQQLDVERQRVSALAQVETENRLIEAAVTRAVEEKQQIEATVLGLQQEVSRLQKIVTSKSGVCS